MKKFIFVSTILILVIFLSGCTLSSQQTSEINNSFSKKRDCAELQNNIEKRIKEQFNDQTRGAWLEKIFYSPTLNTCMYTIQINIYPNKYNNMTTYYIYQLYDAFSNELIEDERGCIPEDECEKSVANASLEFRNKINKFEQ